MIDLEVKATDVRVGIKLGFLTVMEFALSQALTAVDSCYPPSDP